MFSNIGKKIKGLAKFICWICIIAFCALGVSVLIPAIRDNLGAGEIIKGVLIIVGGIIISWISVFFTYGFGELIDKTAEIAENTKK